MLVASHRIASHSALRPPQQQHTAGRATVAERHSSTKDCATPCPPPNPKCPFLPGGWWDDRLPCPSSQVPPKVGEKNTNDRRTGGEGIGIGAKGKQHKGSWSMYPCRAGPLLAAARTAAPFSWPCLPVMRIIPASAGWQAQHGRCGSSSSSSGSGSGISTQGSCSRPRRRRRPFRQHLVRPGLRGMRSWRRGEGGGLKVAILGEYCYNSSVDRGLLMLLFADGMGGGPDQAASQPASHSPPLLLLLA